MTPTLSVVLPVCNAERRLPAQVDALLEILPDLTRQFELLVVDDGSIDETPHIADEISRRYPQVRTVRHPVPLGLEESIQTGIDNTAGEIVLVGDAQQGLPADDLLSLWQLRHDDNLIAARRSDKQSAERPPLGRMLRRLAGQEDAQPATRGAHIVRRGKLDELRLDAPAAANTHRPTTRPNFLDRLKAFAVGE